MSATQVTLSFNEFDKMRNEAQKLEATIQGLRTELEAARVGDGEGDRARLAEALSKALEIVTFGIAHLHPLTVRGWPFQALRDLGALLANCPGVPKTFQECAKGDWELFAAEAERWEKARAEGREQEMLAEENAARGVPADHPIFGTAQPSS